MNNKVAIITGSGSGLGKAIATRFSIEGATAIVVDVNESAMAGTVREIQEAGGKARGFNVDITQRESVHQLMAEVVNAEGHVDILVNNAGITRYRDFASVNSADWDAVLNLDLKGVFFCAQAAAPHMRRQNSGKIVNISSSLGTGTTPHIGGLSAGASSPYASAKAAVIQLTKTLARELGSCGVNVNCVAPGFFLTPLTGTTRSPEEVEEHIRVRKSMAVLNRAGKLEELAHAVLFLASEEAGFITGHTLYVDGGRTDRM